MSCPPPSIDDRKLKLYARLDQAGDPHDREVLKLAIRSLLVVYCNNLAPGAMPTRKRDLH